MRINLTILILLSFCLYLTGADYKQVVTEMQVTRGDSVFKYNYLYNNDTIIVVETKSVKTATGWLNLLQKEWYPSEKTKSGLVLRKWNGSSWQDLQSINYSLSDNILTENQIQISGSEQTITHSEISEFTTGKTRVVSYNNSGNTATRTAEKALYYTNQLLDSTIILTVLSPDSNSVYKTIYTYETNGKFKQTTVQFLKNQKWVNLNKTNWFYSNNNISSFRNYSWNSKSGKWENENMTDYTYNTSDNKEIETCYEWSFERWTPIFRYFYLYDANNNIAKKEVMLPIYREWRSIFSVDYYPDINSKNLTAESVYTFWGGKTGEKLLNHMEIPFNNEILVQNGQTINIKYGPFIGTNIHNFNHNSETISAFPNPSKGVFYISAPENAVNNWTLYNLNGEVLKKSNPNISSYIVDLTDMPNGIYVISVACSNSTKTLKLIKH